MELIAAGLWGIRRFDNQKGPLMDVVGSPIAVVGPNEAGKTTFLRALELLNDDEEINERLLTRGGDGKACVRAIFRLEPADLEAIRDLVGGTKPRILRIWKREGGDIYSALEPEIERDLEPRQKTRVAVDALRRGRWGQQASAELASALAAVAELVTSDDLLSEEEIEQLEAARALLEKAEDAPAKAKRFVANLEELIELEEVGDPDAAARRILLQRRPRFLWFDERWRVLESSFSILHEPSEAMRALFLLAGFDLSELRNAVKQANQPRITELIEEANGNFDSLFTGRWQQANVRVTVDRDGETIHVYVRNARGRLIPIAERSEGLRQFIALLAFVESEAAEENVVLLVDEAENHLHYDAQADLVHVFSTQNVVDKIIYTTHSAGCLPPDLGTGVRVIEPVGPDDQPPEDWERSRIRNAFWTKGPGFSPLLLAMGARTFAFSALRRAVVGEGISEAMLLPTLFREANPNGQLDFQVVPGISNVRPDDVEELNAAAACIAYVVDADEGGEQQRQKLTSAGVASARILNLVEGEDEIALEDLIVKSIYVQAVNREIEHDGQQIGEAELPDAGRKRVLEEWCRQRGINKPSEREVAQHILEHSRQARRRGEAATILEARHRRAVKQLQQRVLRLLGPARAR